MQRIIPNIWCDRTAEEVGAFYASVFPGARSETTGRYPSEGLLDFQKPLAGEALTVSVTIDDYELVLINAGPEFSPNPSISFMVNVDPLRWGGDEQAARRHLDAVWAGLSSGGRVLMPLQEYPFSAHYGWIEDRYGVSWQLILTDPRGEPRPPVMPSLLFGASAQNRAGEALDEYVRVFTDAGFDAALGSVFPYPEPTGPAPAGAVMFGEFRVGDQWFVAMDSGSEQETDFSCGVSLQVDCEGQAQIDALWDALSAVPEAEQCGWLADRFGVSWQIVPANMEELMARPGAYEKMLSMKRLVVADF